MELQSYHYPGNIRELRNILSVAAAQVTDGRLDTKNIAEVVRCMKSRRRVSRTRRASDNGVMESPEPKALAADTPLSEKRRTSEVVELDSRPSAETGKPALDEPTLQNMEAQHISQLLELHEGNRRQVAAALGISERTMYRKLKRYGLT